MGSFFTLPKKTKTSARGEARWVEAQYIPDKEGGSIAIRDNRGNYDTVKVKEGTHAKIKDKLDIKLAGKPAALDLMSLANGRTSVIDRILFLAVEPDSLTTKERYDKLKIHLRGKNSDCKDLYELKFFLNEHRRLKTIPPNKDRGVKELVEKDILSILGALTNQGRNKLTPDQMNGSDHKYLKANVTGSKKYLSL